MFITGYYEFEIIVRKLIRTQTEERIIHRRYSDIEWLHEGLLRHNPGCRIINLPEKSFWANLNVNNVQLLENRKKQIEEYLNYINSHKFLSQNPNYTLFLSDEFEKNKNDTSNKSSFYDKFMNLTHSLPSVFKTPKMKGLAAIEGDDKLDKERENLVRLLKAIVDLKKFMNEYIKFNEEKAEAIKNLHYSAKNLNYVSLDYKNAMDFSYEEEEEKNTKVKADKSISKNMDILNLLYEKNKNYCNLIISNIPDQIEVYTSLII
jgi:hypothetical protein